MKTDWDYTGMSKVYLARPNYSSEVLQNIYAITGLKRGDKVCDVGAGVAHLSLPLEEYGCQVDAVEPNDDMRRTGMARTQGKRITWYEGIAEETGRETGQYDLVSFGSSFGVCDREKALKETARLLKPGRWFVCIWNHRDLDDPVQKNIEEIIAKNIPGYEYGTRREDQGEIIRQSGLFDDVQRVEGRIDWEMTLPEIMTAWLSHATLKRQAGDKFDAIVGEIEAYLKALNKEKISVPYMTRGWVARRR